MHRLEQAPEGAEQAEEDQEADQIAAEFPSLVEAGGDRIEDGAGREGREAARAGAGVEHRRHRREQERLGDRAAVRGPGQRVDPADLAKEPDDLPEGEQRADRQHAEDQPVEAGIGGEGERDLLVEDEHDEADQRQERRHPDEEDARGGEKTDIGVRGHESPNERSVERGYPLIATIASFATGV